VLQGRLAIHFPVSSRKQISYSSLESRIEPDAPDYVHAISLNATSVEVTFAPPSDDGGSPVTQYLVSLHHLSSTS